MENVNEWWASLTVLDKQKIVQKAYKKGKDESAKGMSQYPRCTAWWNSISEEKKQMICEHCAGKHGMLTGEWFEGETYSY